MLLDELVRRNAALLSERLHGARPCWDKPLAIYGIPYGFVHQRENCPARSVPGWAIKWPSFLLFSATEYRSHCTALFLAAENYLHANEVTLSPPFASRRITITKEALPPAAILSRMMSAPLMQPWLFWACRTFPPLVGAAATSTFRNWALTGSASRVFFLIETINVGATGPGASIFPPLARAGNALD